MTNNKQIQAKNILNKVMGFKEIKKLNIDMFQGKSKQVLESEYNVKKSNFISEQMSKWDKSKNESEGEWLRLYPLGYDDWVKDYTNLNSFGEQRVIDKINEIIEFINKN